MNLRRHPFVVMALVLAIVAGCGSPPPPRSAQDEISKAERFVEAAKDWERKAQLDQALDNYKQAKELINKGTSFAEGNQLSRLRYLEDEVRTAVASLEMRKLTREAARLERPQVAVNAQLKAEDPEEKKRKEEETAKKKLQAGQAKASAAIEDMAKSVSSPALGAKKDKKDAALESDVVEKKETPKAGEKNKERTSEETPAPASLKAEGPFPPITEKSPTLEVCKLEFRGNTAIAYFQIYNNAEAGKRIMNAMVYFKDANNAPLIEPRSTAVFPFKGFKADAPSIFDQSLVTALTAGSAQVTGFEGLRLVGVGEHEKVKDIKKVSVKMIYHDGTSDDATGPKDGPTEASGVKALETKK